MNIIRRRQRGVAAVELGLLLIPMTALVLGVAEYGRAMYQYNALAKAARTGARYLSQYMPGDSGSQTKAKCLVVFGNTACSGTSLLPGLTVATVYVDDSVNTASLKSQDVVANGVTVGVTNLVRVRVQGYTFQSVGSYLVGNFPFDPISVTMSQALP